MKMKACKRKEWNCMHAKWNSFACFHFLPQLLYILWRNDQFSFSLSSVPVRAHEGWVRQQLKTEPPHITVCHPLLISLEQTPKQLQLRFLVYSISIACYCLSFLMKSTRTINYSYSVPFENLDHWLYFGPINWSLNISISYKSCLLVFSAFELHIEFFQLNQKLTISQTVHNKLIKLHWYTKIRKSRSSLKP